MSTTISEAQLQQVPVGDLQCQRDPFIRQFSTECIACSEKPNKKGLYEVYLKDTSKQVNQITQ
jgi:hypothetical protein